MPEETTGEESSAVPEQAPEMMESLSPAPPETLDLERERSHTPLDSELVMDDLAGPYCKYRRAKSPFELGRKENVLKSSTMAIIDKASVMDISVPNTNAEEDIQNYFRHIYQNLIFDMASIQDITTFNEGTNIEIVVVEEGDDEPEEDASQAKKKLRWNRDPGTHPIVAAMMRKAMQKKAEKRKKVNNRPNLPRLLPRAKKNRRHPNRMSKK